MNLIKRVLLVLIFLCLCIAQGKTDFRASASQDKQEAGLTLISSGNEGVVFELVTPSFELQPGNDDQHEYQLLNVPGLEQSLQGGKPQLPLKGVLIGVPAEAEFSLKILEDENEILKEKYDIQPVGVPEGMIDDFQPGAIIYKPDEAVYQSASLYPASAVSMAEPAWIREQRVLQVSIYPFQYLPADKTLVWHKRLRIEVSFTTDRNKLGSAAAAMASDEAGSASPFEATFQSQLINYESAREFRVSPALTSLPGNQALAVNAGFNQTQSLGPRYKIVVDHDGIYRITRDELEIIHSVSGVDPEKLMMINQGRKVAISIENNNHNGIFDKDEAIIFYGQKFFGEYLAEMYSSEDDLWLTYERQLPDGSYTQWTPTMNAIMMEKYTDDNVYWLVTGDDPLWMPTVDGAPQNINPVPETYTTTVHAEQSHHWFTRSFSSEDTWYWKKITSAIETSSFPITLTSLSSNIFTATVSGELVGEKPNSFHNAKIFINNNKNLIKDAVWKGTSRYRFLKEIPQSTLIDGENQLLVKMESDSHIIYFDWFEIEYLRNFQAENDWLQFERDEADANWQYEISNYLSNKVVVLDVTNPLTPTNILSATVTAGVAAFEGQAHSGSGRYVAAGLSAIQSPKSLTYYTPPTPDLYAASNQADYLFITHNAFRSGVQTLANYRAAQGLTTRIIDFEDLVNEFNFGIYHPIAIKNFLRYTFAHWQKPAPSYVLLVGDGHWNFKNYSGVYEFPINYMPPFLAWVDPEQGEIDASNDLSTIIGNDALPDLNLGRIPVNDLTELEDIIQKIIKYETTPVQEWQRYLLFVADNPDHAGDFVQLSNEIIHDYISPVYVANKIYLNNFTDNKLCHANLPRTCPEVNTSIINFLNQTGALIVNYIGHGGVYFWASENIFIKDDIFFLNNGNKLPIILSFTCLDGYWYHPGAPLDNRVSPISFMEALLRAKNKGTVSTFSSTGLGDVIGHDLLQRGFYDALFLHEVKNLGEATLIAKTRLNRADPNSYQIHSYLILGDPALKIQLPFVSPKNASQVVNPGKSGIYKFMLAHNAAITDTYTISMNATNWHTEIPSMIGPLSPATFPILSYTLPVTVTVPQDAKIKSSDMVTLTISSNTYPEKTERVTLRTIADYIIYLPTIIR